MSAAEKDARELLIDPNDETSIHATDIIKGLLADLDRLRAERDRVFHIACVFAYHAPNQPANYDSVDAMITIMEMDEDVHDEQEIAALAAHDRQHEELPDDRR